MRCNGRAGIEPLPPAALPLYQRLGFEPVGVGEEEVEAWD
jgi:hypothetical protein